MSSSRSVTAGYVVLGLLGLSDALGFLLASGDDAPPVLVNVAGTILGLITLWGLFSIVRARRQGGGSPRQAVLAVAITRTLSALLGIPAFFADIPGGIKAVIAVSIVLTIAGLGLVRPEIDAARSGGAAAAPA